jgi:transposase
LHLLREAGRVQKHQRRFGAMTQDLHELAEWLRQFGVTQVAVESSGVYWKPVWNILEGQFTVVLANAQHIKSMPGRKIDQKAISLALSFRLEPSRCFAQQDCGKGFLRLGDCCL